MDAMQQAIRVISDVLGAEPIPVDPVIAALLDRPAKRAATPSAASSRHKVARGLRAAEKMRVNPSAAKMRGKL